MNLNDIITKQITDKAAQIDAWTLANPDVSLEDSKAAGKIFMTTDFDGLATASVSDQDLFKQACEEMELDNLASDLDMLRNTQAKIIEGKVVEISCKYLVMEREHHPISPSGFSPTEPVILVNGAVNIQCDTLPKYLSPNLHAFDMGKVIEQGAAL